MIMSSPLCEVTLILLRRSAAISQRSDQRGTSSKLNKLQNYHRQRAFASELQHDSTAPRLIREADASRVEVLGSPRLRPAAETLMN
jgi:hypothetical protein